MSEGKREASAEKEKRLAKKPSFDILVSFPYSNVNFVIFLDKSFFTSGLYGFPGPFDEWP